MAETIRYGFIGLGERGYWLIRDVILEYSDMEISAVCDLHQERIDRCVEMIREKGRKTPFVSTDYHEILVRDDVDAVVIVTGWEKHVPLVLEAMRAGKPVACEVGGAYSVQDCWDLVHMYEETRTPVFFLENCCYGRLELMALRMVRDGLFGTVVHCEGGYRHDIRNEIVRDGWEKGHYRLRNYMDRNLENYPTHEIGPIAKILDINRGNRFLSLTSTASGSFGLNEFAAKEYGDSHPLAKFRFAQGDVVTTVLKCAFGQTVSITLDTSLPRWYSRGFCVQGTRGILSEDRNAVLIESGEIPYERNNLNRYYEKYDHPIWKRFSEQGVKGGHGGMDGLEFCAVTEAIRTGAPAPVDVYDMAVWAAISPLSEQSIAQGGAPVSVPDFTSGRWMNREAAPDWAYSLDFKG